MDNEIFANIIKEDPLTIPMGGRSTPYRPCDWKAVFDHEGDSTYTCGINFSWLNLKFSPTPGIPIRMTGINQM